MPLAAFPFCPEGGSIQQWRSLAGWHGSIFLPPLEMSGLAVSVSGPGEKHLEQCLLSIIHRLEYLPRAALIRKKYLGEWWN